MKEKGMFFLLKRRYHRFIAARGGVAPQLLHKNGKV
jgi:hypothetical protein